MSNTGMPAPLPSAGQVVQTACGGQVEFYPETPHALYNGHWIFFCLPVCMKDFQRDPASSCLAVMVSDEY